MPPPVRATIPASVPDGEVSAMARILVVDDNPDACLVMVKFLRNAGHQAFAATSGGAALAKLKGELPDLVLLDIMMPGLDGETVLRRVRKDPRTRDLKVIAFSAIVPISTKTVCITAGVLGMPFPEFVTGIVIGRTVRYAVIATVLKFAGERLRDWLLRRAGNARRTRVMVDEGPLPPHASTRA